MGGTSVDSITLCSVLTNRALRYTSPRCCVQEGMLKSKDLEIDRLKRQLAAANQVIDKQGDTLAVLRSPVRRGSKLSAAAANTHKIVTESDLRAMVEETDNFR